jgi:hypothetical protein
MEPMARDVTKQKARCGVAAGLGLGKVYVLASLPNWAKLRAEQG